MTKQHLEDLKKNKPTPQVRLDLYRCITENIPMTMSFGPTKTVDSFFFFPINLLRLRVNAHQNYFVFL